MRKDRFQFTKTCAIVATFLIFLAPLSTFAADFKTFDSAEYGFSMKYPATWIKIDKPQGNYYVVFQDPDLTDNFRAKIHVAAHQPVNDQLSVFLQELRNGITDLQKGTGTAKEKQEVRILDEGEFKCGVPGAYYFFIQAYENSPKTWMDIVIVFYKLDQTLIRVSCLAPSKSMEKFHELFNEVLTSVHFNTPAPASNNNVQPNGAPGAPVQAKPSAPSSVEASPQSVAPAPTQQQQQPAQPPPSSVRHDSGPVPAPGPAPAGPPQRPGPRGPARESDRPATGIVN
ncbi:MAG: hypothetical protein M0T73_17735 [Deltaproteobacteria bacterium]|nr:hypothetical protein [Deltaproteobacteria bacterium]